MDERVQRFAIANIYCPGHNSERNDFYQMVSKALDPRQDVVLVGDFNSVLDPWVDRWPGCRFCQPHYDSPQELANILVDTWRNFHSQSHGFTYRRPDATSASRIDMINVADCFVPVTDSITICPCVHSDHDAISIAISASISKIGVKLHCYVPTISWPLDLSLRDYARLLVW